MFGGAGSGAPAPTLGVGGGRLGDGLGEERGVEVEVGRFEEERIWSVEAEVSKGATWSGDSQWVLGEGGGGGGVGLEGTTSSPLSPPSPSPSSPPAGPSSSTPSAALLTKSLKAMVEL